MWGGEKRMPQGCPEGPSGRMREEPPPSCSPHRHTHVSLSGASRVLPQAATRHPGTPYSAQSSELHSQASVWAANQSCLGFSRMARICCPTWAQGASALTAPTPGSRVGTD